MAVRLPHTIETSGRIATRSATAPVTGVDANRRTAASSTAALTIVAMYAVTGTLAPSYASGAHAWNGTTAALRKNATMTSATPACAMESEAVSAAAKAANESEAAAP